MKIGIVTFHCAVNYGALLQTYGLYRVLTDMGHDVKVVDYRPQFLLRPYRIIFKERYSILKPKGFIRELAAAPIRIRRNRHFAKFISKHIALEQIDLNSSDNNFDAFIFGSDQIWNPHITEGDTTYFAEAPAFRGKLNIAYAASAGSVANFNDDWNSKIIKLINNFNAVSLREASLANHIRNISGIDFPVLPDPVILSGAQTFAPIAEPYKAKKPYMIYFALWRSNDNLQKAHAIAKRRGLELVEIVSNQESIKNLYIEQSASFERLISLYRGADFVVSGSFHGTVLAIIFNKEFAFFHQGLAVSERIENLLADLSLSDRIIKGSTDIPNKPIDWGMVNDALELRRRQAFQFLAEALTLPQ